MATIDATLDSFMIPALPTYSHEFGTKKASGGLSTAECVDVTAMPFNRQRPFAVTETSETTEVQANSAFRITQAGVTLTIADAAFEGCEAVVVNASDGDATVKGGVSGLNGSANGATLEAGAVLHLVYRGGWITRDAASGQGDSKLYGGLDVAGDAAIGGDVSAAGSASITGTLDVGSKLTVAGETELAGAVTAGSSISAEGDISSGGDISAGGGLDVAEGAAIAGQATINGATIPPDDYDCLYNGKFHAYTVAGLLAWADYMKENEDYSVDCVLHNSLDMEGVEWTPAADYANTGTAYTGCFDGGGHALHNLAIETDTDYAGFISYLGSGGKVMNLHIVGGSVAGSSTSGYTGAIAGYCSGGAIEGCSNSADVTGYYTGGIAGYAYSSTVSNCTNSADVSGYCAGGIAGYAINYVTVSRCTNTGAVTGSDSTAGGIVGAVFLYCTIGGCSNSATVTSSGDYTGGIAGYSGSIMGIGGCTISRCTNSGAVTGSGTYTGGIAGDVGTSSEISNCTNSGTVTGKGARTGGIAGEASSSTVSSCTNSGTVTCSGDTAGGIVGLASNPTRINACSNTASVTASGNYAGGIAGAMQASCFANACSNSGTIKSSSRAGGIVGGMQATSSYAAVSCCVNSGTCTGTYTGYAVGERPNSTYNIVQYNTRIAGPTSAVG